MTKITAALLRNLEKQVSKEKISYSRIVEIINKTLNYQLFVLQKELSERNQIIQNFNDMNLITDGTLIDKERELAEKEREIVRLKATIQRDIDISSEYYECFINERQESQNLEVELLECHLEISRQAVKASTFLMRAGEEKEKSQKLYEAINEFKQNYFGSPISIQSAINKLNKAISSYEYTHPVETKCTCSNAGEFENCNKKCGHGTETKQVSETNYEQTKQE